MAYPQRPPGGGGLFANLHLTETGKRLLGVYAAVWFVLTILAKWTGGEWFPRRVRLGIGPEGLEVPTSFDLWQVLVLTPPGGSPPGFHVWQLVTAHFVHPPDAFFSLFFSGLALLFFGSQVEGGLGTRRFLEVWVAAAIGSVLGALLFAGIQGAVMPEFGPVGAILSLVVIFCALRPEATILLFFVLPIQAKWVWSRCCATSLNFASA